MIQDDRFYVIDSVTICAFTMDSTDAPLIRLAVAPSSQNGLRDTSSLMVDKITTVRRSKLGERIGWLDGVQADRPVS